MEIKEVSSQDWSAVKLISRSCGSQSVRKGFGYIRFIRHHAGEKCVAYLFGDVGVYVCLKARNHIRLLEFAVLSPHQRKGIGSMMFAHLTELAKDLRLSKITLRTSMYEPAINFWESRGGVIVGIKGSDYQVEINLTEIEGGAKWS